MTALELVRYQIETVGGQLERTLVGLQETSLENRLHALSFGVAEQLDHLADAYQAVITHCEGGKHEWGMIKLKSDTVEGRIQEMKSLRYQAAELLLVEDEEKLKMAADYIVAHDNYHLGQLVSLRMMIEPNWDSYIIYG